jgi:hypothetical protein
MISGDENMFHTGIVRFISPTCPKTNAKGNGYESNRVDFNRMFSSLTFPDVIDILSYFESIFSMNAPNTLFRASDINFSNIFKDFI